MRTKSSKQQGNKGGIEVEKLSKLNQEPHLSGAYIRSLVKQLTSSRPKDPMDPKALDVVDGNGLPPHNLPKLREGFTETHQTHHPQPKKQVRRRLHTSRPYQERLLNMAEARREIVTALKFHRASMKQANEQQHIQSLKPPPSPPEQEDGMSSHITYPSNYLENFSYLPYSCPPPNPFPWASSQVPLPIVDNLNLTLPNQPLGLNLNFHDFNNIDTTLYYHNDNNSPSTYLYASPSSSSSPTLSSTEVFHSGLVQRKEPHLMADITNCGVMNGGLHPAFDDEEMAEIRSIGEQHEMEWNDTMNLVTSAWWFKFSKKMETSPEKREEHEEDYGYNPFDEVLEFPGWMNANESLQQHLDDYNSKDYLQEAALPCMDIGEIEGMDAEWLA